MGIDNKKLAERMRTATSFFAGAASATSSKKDKINRAKKLTIRILKAVIYLFFLGIGLYGCFQNMTDHWTVHSTTVGNGYEIGFHIDPAVGAQDIRFDLVYAGSGAWYPMDSFSFDYGPFYALFVWPIAQILLHFMYATRDWPVGLNAILGLIIILLIIRLITILITARATIHGERMSEIQGKVAEINAKYKGAKDVLSQQKRRIELKEIYAKNNINQFAPFESMIITLPIFLIIYRVVTILRPLKFITIFNAWDLTATPVSEIFSNFTSTGWPYIFFLLIIIPVQILSQKIPQWLARKRSRAATTVGAKNQQQLKKTRMTQNIIMIVLAIIVAISASGIGLYWFFNAIFTIIQSVIIHKIIMKKRANSNTKIESKLSRLGIN
ncbi:protein translocase component YidC [Ureaplasma diversum]|uniref:Membrane protein OxaA n=2 Tax=Ureaplasma diversum TaxID=42094 RepID=A0A084EZQ2_9BACT|nr:membrane protein insertase YidC [Ureaplasma diversum]AJQ45642.1 protein translocase component YidC [Ureaplasma diversum]KEZ23444.1 Membrane protein OxaA [Ureaplasma diversum NCTC 246]